MSSDEFIYPADSPEGPLLEDNVGENRYRAEVESDGKVRITDECNHRAWISSYVAYTHDEIRQLRGGE